MESNHPSTKIDCPILFVRKNPYGHDEYEIFPILKDYNVGKVISPERIWIMLSEWLAKEKPIENKQTDKEKIVSKGFDIKTSFRKM